MHHSNLNTMFLLCFLISWSPAQSQAQSQETDLLSKTKMALDTSEQVKSIKALVPTLNQDSRAVSYLIHQLSRQKNPIIRGQIARALQHIGGQPQGTENVRPRVIGALIDALDDNELYVDPTEPMVSGQVLRGKWSVQAEAARSLGVLKAVDEEAIEKLADIASDPDVRHVIARNQAAKALGLIGPEASSATWAVASLLGTGGREFQQLRMTGIFSLGKIGPGAANAVPKLLPFVETPCAEQVAVITVIGKMGPAAKSAIPLFWDKLCLPLKPGGSGSNLHFAHALANMRPEIEPIILRASKSDDIDQVRGAIHVIAMMGHDVDFAIESLRNLTDHPDQHVRHNAVIKLSRSKKLAKSALMELDRTIDNVIPLISLQAIHGVLKVDPSHQKALNKLLIHVQKPELVQQVANCAVVAGTHANALKLQFEQLINDGDNPFQQINLATALVAIDTDSELGLRTLTESIKSKNYEVRRSAYAACKRLGAKARKLLPVLESVNEVKELDKVQRREAIRAIRGVSEVDNG